MESNQRLKLFDILREIMDAMIQHRYGDVFLEIERAERVLEDGKP